MRILAVDDNPIIRMGLRTLLEGAEGVTSVIDTGDPEEAVAHVLAGWVDVVLLDVRMPAVSGLELLPRLAGGATVVMLTHTDDPATVAEAMAAGAAGYLVHGALEPNAMVDAMRLCQGGSQVVSGVTAGSPAVGHDPVPGHDPSVRGLLSPREAEVMDLVADGLSNGEVAHSLFVSEKTVKNHVNSLFAKLGVTTRSQAIVLWLRRGHGPVPDRPGDPTKTGPDLGPHALGRGTVPP
ncbi:response regulator transcription factor [Myceligenerans pegani]|uniref:Response regulator transcription factor n=1 Tax=Myceligenerans pegani TaxID=2776917 RepID=A0ABR9N4J3_9MICO|nr:response regulator transcription factor [Myceligenerans sp. TRM 65318]MBE1878578.1 response regulator transcription factor [Myceligenerans sp. TRM 65318]MBE3020849.1 response regulator transcription factor [Myceligenerans sp. TRM 65318]